MPKQKTYGFKQKEVVEQLKQIAGGGESPFPDLGMGGAKLYLMQSPGGGIAARSGSTISSANCTLYSGAGGTLTATSVTLPVYNLSTTAVGASKYIIAAFAGGVLIAVWEDC